MTIVVWQDHYGRQHRTYPLTDSELGAYWPRESFHRRGVVYLVRVKVVSHHH